MKRNNKPEELREILGSLGLNLDEVNNFVDAGRQLRKVNPCLRFDMDSKEAFGRILRCYQIEVQSRRCVFKLDTYTADVLRNITLHMTQLTPKSGIMLCGMKGNGKTTLATAMLRLIRELYNSGRMKFMGEYFSAEGRIIKATDVIPLYKAENYEAIGRLKHMPILIIDDLGEEPKEAMIYGTPMYPLREILEARYDSLLFTIVTTNLTPHDLPDHYGWRVVDRFTEMYQTIVHRGPSYRPQEL